MAYIGKVTDGHAMTLGKEVGIIETTNYEVVWRNESDGKETHACNVGSCSRRDTRAKAALQRKMDNYVGRYASYAQRKGIRYEVMRKEKTDRKLRIQKAPSRAVQTVMESAFNLWKSGTYPHLVAGIDVTAIDQSALDELAVSVIAEVRQRALKAAKRAK